MCHFELFSTTFFDPSPIGTYVCSVLNGFSYLDEILSTYNILNSILYPSAGDAAYSAMVDYNLL